MTEVPDYLLRRSRERREALGLAPKGAPPTEGAPASSPATTAGGSSPATASGAPAAAGSAPPLARSAPPVAPPAPPQTGVWPRSGIPVWMMPVLLVLPLWAIVYVGAFGERGGAELTADELGAQVYQTSGCAACHGAAGQGVGAFPALAGGASVLTFPDEADHVSWVETGSGPFRGQPYGDPGRAGGQRVATSGGMPGFAGILTPEEIAAVVAFERSAL